MCSFVCLQALCCHLASLVWHFSRKDFSGLLWHCEKTLQHSILLDYQSSWQWWTELISSFELIYPPVGTPAYAFNVWQYFLAFLLDWELQWVFCVISSSNISRGAGKSSTRKSVPAFIFLAWNTCIPLCGFAHNLCSTAVLSCDVSSFTSLEAYATALCNCDIQQIGYILSGHQLIEEHFSLWALT